MNYKGENQAGEFYCVFASIVGAVNSIAQKTVWTQDALLQKWREQKIKDEDLNFTNIWQVAIQPVKDKVKAWHHVDSAAAIPKSDYLKMIKECVNADGVAIVSLEKADLAGSALKRNNRWHMLSLISRKGDDFEAWDTAGGNVKTVTAEQLLTNIPYGKGVLAVHQKHDMLLIQSA